MWLKRLLHEPILSIKNLQSTLAVGQLLGVTGALLKLEQRTSCITRHTHFPQHYCDLLCDINISIDNAIRGYSEKVQESATKTPIDTAYSEHSTHSLQISRL